MAATAPPPRVVRLGSRDVPFPSAELAQIEDSAPLLALGDGGASLRARFARDGFVYLRGALGAAPVAAALARVRGKLEAAGGVLDEATGLLLPACGLGCVPNLEGVNGTTHAPEVLGVLEGAPLRAAAAALLGAEPGALRSFDYKWLRAMPRAAFTGVHCDAVYMARGSRALLTAWVPFDARAPLELGGLALLRGSHAAPALAALRATYGAFDTEAEPRFEGSGWLTTDPFDAPLARAAAAGEVQWVSGDYAAGDVILFGLQTLHASTANLTDAARVSADVRWQLAAEPIDDRYVGSADEMRDKAAQRKKGGAWASDGARAAAAAALPQVTIDDLRSRWGV
jgi:hypothetical protein